MSIRFNFTETAYKDLIESIKNNGYTFALFSCASGTEHKHVLLRHDIDMSPHRAATLAAIEKQKGAISTYFLHLHSKFYNLFEDNVVEKINMIIDCEQVLGLHFDIDFYTNNFKSIDPFDMIDIERDFVWDTFGRKPMAISFHIPSLSSVEIPDSEKIRGIPNANSKYIRENYAYCSDSNAMWNHNSIESLIEKSPKIHLLIHPEWWTYNKMDRMDKAFRCINGRCDYQVHYYNMIMEDVYAKKYR